MVVKHNETGGKLERLACAAAEFYEIPLEILRSPCREAIYTKPRHTCQWLAADAGIQQSTIARFWRVDHASINYGCRIVATRIKTSAYELSEVKRFMRHVARSFGKVGKSPTPVEG